MCPKSNLLFSQRTNKSISQRPDKARESRDLSQTNAKEVISPCRKSPHCFVKLCKAAGHYYMNIDRSKYGLVCFALSSKTRKNIYMAQNYFFFLEIGPVWGASDRWRFFRSYYCQKLPQTIQNFTQILRSYSCIIQKMN